MATAQRTFTPEPNSLAERVLQLFRKQPREEFDSADFFQRFQATSNVQQSMLATPLNLQLLSYERRADDLHKMWRAGARFAEWAAATVNASGSAAVPAPAAAGKPAGGAAQPRAPRVALNAADVVIKQGAPIPEPARGVNTSAYKDLWERMKPGDCAELSDRHAHSLAAFCKKAGHAFTVRRLRPGVKGVWRLAPADKAAANDPKAAAKPATKKARA